MLRRSNLSQPQILRDMRRTEFRDVRRRNLQSIFKQSVKEETAAVALGVRALEVNFGNFDAMDLLICIGGAVAHGDDQNEKVGMFLRDFGEDLDEIEGPSLPRVLLGIGQPVE